MRSRPGRGRGEGGSGAVLTPRAPGSVAAPAPASVSASVSVPALRPRRGRQGRRGAARVPHPTSAHRAAGSLRGCHPRSKSSCQAVPPSCAEPPFSGSAASPEGKRARASLREAAGDGGEGDILTGRLGPRSARDDQDLPLPSPPSRAKRAEQAQQARRRRQGRPSHRPPLLGGRGERAKRGRGRAPRRLAATDSRRAQKRQARPSRPRARGARGSAPRTRSGGGRRPRLGRGEEGQRALRGDGVVEDPAPEPLHALRREGVRP